MIDEKSHRREGFLPGTTVPLADGGFWILPSAPSKSIATTRFGTDYDSLLEAITVAEDEPERLRAELALAIHLLSLNYELEPEDYKAILAFPPNSSALHDAQHVFRSVAQEHIAIRRGVPGSSTPRRNWLSRLLGLGGYPDRDGLPNPTP